MSEVGGAPEQQTGPEQPGAEPYRFGKKTLDLLRARVEREAARVQEALGSGGVLDEEAKRKIAVEQALHDILKSDDPWSVIASRLVNEANPGVDFGTTAPDRRYAAEDLTDFGRKNQEVQAATMRALQDEFSEMPADWVETRRRGATARMDEIEEAAPWVRGASRFADDAAELVDLLNDYENQSDDEQEPWRTRIVDERLRKVGGNLSDEELLAAKKQYADDLRVVIDSQDDIFRGEDSVDQFNDYKHAEDILDHLPEEELSIRDRAMNTLGKVAEALKVPYAVAVKMRIELGNLVKKGLDYVGGNDPSLTEEQRETRRKTMGMAATLGVVAVGALLVRTGLIGEVADMLDFDSTSDEGPSRAQAEASAGPADPTGPSSSPTSPASPGPSPGAEALFIPDDKDIPSRFQSAGEAAPPDSGEGAFSPDHGGNESATARSNSVESEAEQYLRDLKAEGQLDSLDSANRAVIEDVLEKNNPEGFKKGDTINVEGLNEALDTIAKEEANASATVSAESVLYEAKSGDSIEKIADRLLEAHGINNPEPELREAVEQALIDNNYTYNGSAHWIDKGQVMHLGEAQDLIGEYLNPSTPDAGGIPEGLDGAAESQTDTNPESAQANAEQESPQRGGEDTGDAATQGGSERTGAGGFAETLTGGLEEKPLNVRVGEDAGVLMRLAGVPPNLSETVLGQVAGALVASGILVQVPTFQRYKIAGPVPRSVLGTIRAAAKNATSRP